MTTAAASVSVAREPQLLGQTVVVSWKRRVT